MTKKRYQLDILCAICQQKGKIIVVGSLLSKVPFQKEALDEFLAKHNDADFICNRCSENIDRNATRMTGIDARH
jgi:hypothetical protein